jgi:homoserine kinase
METRKVRAFAPATVANVACGFDVLGFAVEKPGDEVELYENNKGKVVVESIIGDGGKLPLDAAKNTSAVAVSAMLQVLGKQSLGISINIKKMMPLGSGLGSSAASAAAALVALNELLGNPLTRSELVPFAIEAERMACGSGHADNVAPSLLGGFVLIRSYKPLDLISIPSPVSLFCTIVHPHAELRTEDSRAALKQTIGLNTATQQWGNLAGLIAGLFSSDFDLISRSLHDEVAEPHRAPLIPGFFDVKHAAMKNGALGSSISGAGPSVFALSTDKKAATEIGNAMQQAFELNGLDSDLYVSQVNKAGAYII